MNLIAGLGNPGREYADTRHNLGFRVVDALAGRWSIPVDRARFRGLTGDGTIAGQRVLILKPSTYMNRSGASVLEAAQFYKLDLQDLLVVYDEKDLPLGRLRLRQDGSAGGHRGLADLIRCFGDDTIPRLRVGIGSGQEDAVSHVLGRFRPEEITAAEHAAQLAADAVECWLTDGIEAAMNRYNEKNP